MLSWTCLVALLTCEITFWMAEFLLSEGCWRWGGGGEFWGFGLVLCLEITLGLLPGFMFILLPKALWFYLSSTSLTLFGADTLGLRLRPFLGSMSYFSSWSILSRSKGCSLAFLSYLTLSAYFRVFRVFSELLLLGEILPIMTVRQYPVKESFRTIVSLLPLKGVWFLFWSKALMHSLSASKLLLISAPSILVCF